MTEQNDWIMRQVKSFAQGLGYVLGKGKAQTDNEIVFPQKEAKNLPHQVELQKLIDADNFQQAMLQLQKLRYAMAEEKYIALGNWLYSTLMQRDPEPINQIHYEWELNKLKALTAEI